MATDYRKPHVMTEYAMDVSELSEFLKGINAEDIITITERAGYTVIYRSNSPYSGMYKKG